MYIGLIFAVLLMTITFGCRRNAYRSSDVIVGHALANTSVDSRPTWSAQSDKIAFRVGGDKLGGNDRILIFNAVKPKKPRLWKTIRVEHGPIMGDVRWSPDDKRLVVEVETLGLGDTPNFASIINIKTGEQADPMATYKDVLSGHQWQETFDGDSFYWQDDQHIVGIERNQLAIYPLSGGTIKHKYQISNYCQTIFKSRYLVGRENIYGGVSPRTLIFDTKTGKQLTIDSSYLRDIAAADNGRALVITDARWIGKAFVWSYAYSTIHFASLSPARLKLGKAIKLVDDEGKILSPETVSISPNGKVAAFIALTASNHRHIYLAELP